jgi:F0F1-type ATP synthase membrane subunit c/vacuolar-type H+-ATPase subunit K
MSETRRPGEHDGDADDQFGGVGGQTLNGANTVTNFNATNTGRGQHRADEHDRGRWGSRGSRRTRATWSGNTGAISTSGGSRRRPTKHHVDGEHERDDWRGGDGVGGSGTVGLTATAGALAVNGAVSSGLGATARRRRASAITETGSLATSGLPTTSLDGRARRAGRCQCGGQLSNAANTTRTCRWSPTRSAR